MKVHIFGASGSGVTTLGNALSEQTNLPYFDTDYFFWEPSDLPFTVKRDPAVGDHKFQGLIGSKYRPLKRRFCPQRHGEHRGYYQLLTSVLSVPLWTKNIL